MAMKYRPKHIIEYAALRLVGATVNILPYRGALCLGAGIAWISFYIFQFRVAEAKRRIRYVLGNDLPKKEINRTAWISWRNIVFNAVEMLRITKATPEWVASHYDAEPFLAKVKAHADTGAGGVIAGPHMGNWELASVPCSQRKLPFFSIAAQQKNPLANDYFNKMRVSTGIGILTRGGSTMKSVIDNLKAGKLLVILPDSRMRTPDLEIPFLGGTANLGKGMAYFAKKTNTPIFPCFCTRIGWTKHKIQTFDTITPDKNLDRHEDIIRMTIAVANMIDKAIREQPEQWFWFNKRWVLDPVDKQKIPDTAISSS